MKKMFSPFKASLRELNNFKTVVLCGLFAAIAVVLGYFTIPVFPFLKIGFSGIPNQVVAALFGPSVAGIFGGVLDIVKYVMNPTGPFFLGFTLDAILAGVIYGMFFYKREVKLWRVFLAHLVVMLVINLGTTTYWLSLTLGKGFLILWPLRALKNVIMLPINSLLFYAVMKALENVIKPMLASSARQAKEEKAK